MNAERCKKASENNVINCVSPRHLPLYIQSFKICKITSGYAGELNWRRGGEGTGLTEIDPINTLLQFLLPVQFHVEGINWKHPEPFLILGSPPLHFNKFSFLFTRKRITSEKLLLFVRGDPGKFRR